jgi:hypothetical protein
MLKGVLHIHSTYSDGELSLRDLKELFVSAGCAFAFMTDHADAFDSIKITSYIQECRALSNNRFCFIPSLEYGCKDRMHVLGYGVTSPVSTQDPQEVIRHIENEGGVSVIAHPRDSAFSHIESFHVLPHGIEVWNTKYDGRYAPRPGSFTLLQRLQQRKPELRAFYGVDLHWKRQFRSLYVTLQCPDNEPANVLDALARGSFHVRKGKLELPSNGEVPEQLLHDFEVAHARAARVRWLIKSGKKMMDRFGVVIPPAIKSQLRRLY